MSYEDWERYNNSRQPSSRRPSTQRPPTRPQSQQPIRPRPTQTSSTQRPRTAPTRPVVKNRQKQFHPVNKNILLVLLVAGLLSGIFAVSMDNSLDAAKGTTSSTSSTAGLLSGQSSKPNKENYIDNSVDKATLEEQLRDYKSYCYVGNYGSNQYLFCPEEYVLKLAEYSIDKVNNLYKSSGKMKLLENGECIPDCITPELLAAICFTESTYRVESRRFATWCR